MFVISLLGGQKNMQNLIMSNMGPSPKLDKVNECQFLKWTILSILNISLIILDIFFIISPYRLKSLMKIILVCSFQREGCKSPTFSLWSHGRLRAEGRGTGKSLWLTLCERNTCWFFQNRGMPVPRLHSSLVGKHFSMLTAAKAQSGVNGRELSSGRNNQVLSGYGST